MATPAPTHLSAGVIRFPERISQRDAKTSQAHYAKINELEASIRRDKRELSRMKDETISALLAGSEQEPGIRHADLFPVKADFAEEVSYVVIIK